MVPSDYWSHFFGLSGREFEEPGTKIVDHVGLSDYNGAWIFKAGESVVISVPPHLRMEITRRLEHISQTSLPLTEEFAWQLFTEAQRVIGPCYQGYNPGPVGAKASATTVRLLSDSDQAHLSALQERVDSEAWEHSSIEPGKTIFGYFQENQLAAAACLDMWTEKVANIGLVTDPSHRGMGLAKRVCEAATQHGLDQGYLMLYQTLFSNQAAVAVAKATGYEHYATHLAVRFK